MKPTYAYFNQVQAERDISASNFSRGQINFKWDNEGHTMFNPARSYFRVRCKLGTGVGGNTNVTPAAGIAPAMYMMDCAFQQMRFRLNGKVVSSMDDYVPQISVLKRRIATSESRARILEEDLQLSQADMHHRVGVIARGGGKTRNTFINQHANQPFVLAQSTPTTIRLINNAANMQTFANAGGNPGRLTITGCNYKASDLFTPGEWLHVNDGGNRVVLIDRIEDAEAGGTLFFAVRVADEAAVAARGPVAYTDAGTTICRKVLDPVLGSNHNPGFNEFEFIWKPALGFWQLDNWVVGKCNLEMTPHADADLQRYVVETSGQADQTGNYTFTVESMLLYTYTGYTDSPYSGSLNYTTQETELQQQNLTTASLTNKTFTVDPNTFALTLAIQAGTAGSDQRISLNNFTMLNDLELQLTRYYIQYKV